MFLLEFGGKRTSLIKPLVNPKVQEARDKPVVSKQIESAKYTHLIGPKSLRYFALPDRLVILLGDRHVGMEFSCGDHCASRSLADYGTEIEEFNKNCGKYLNDTKNGAYRNMLAMKLSVAPPPCIYITEWLMRIANNSPDCVDMFIETPPDNRMTIIGPVYDYLNAVRSIFCGCLKANDGSTYNKAVNCYEMFPSLRLHMVDIRDQAFELGSVPSDIASIKARLMWLLCRITERELPQTTTEFSPDTEHEFTILMYIGQLQELFAKSLFANEPQSFIKAWENTISHLINKNGHNYIVRDAAFTVNLFVFDLYATLRMCVREWVSRPTLIDRVPRTRAMGARCRDQSYPRQVLLYMGERHAEAIGLFLTYMFGNEPLNEQISRDRCITLDATVLPPFCFV